MQLPTEILLPPEASIRDAMERMGASPCQIVLVVEGERRLVGTVTDGDIRRALLRRVSLDEPVQGVMKDTPVVAPVGTEAQTCRELMQERRIQYLPIVDADGRVVGIESLRQLLDEPSWDNWVVIMAGGRGQRLGSLTDELPKPLLPIGGQPILDTIVGNFRRQGFRKLFVSVNYQAERIREHLGDGAARGLSIEFLVEDRPLGTAGSLALLPERPTKPFVVINGDVLTTMNFQHLLAYHADQGALATMCVREFELKVPYGVAELDGPRLVGLTEKPVHRFFVNAGVYLLSPEVLDLVPSEGGVQMTALFERLLERGDKVAAFPLSEYWVDVGRLNDLFQARQDFDAVFGLV